MSANTSIEWATKTWNPVRGCSLVSDGCRHCYAMKQAHRFSGPGGPYEGLTEIGPAGPRWTGRITLVTDALEEPLHWRKPERIFVNSMSDLFHEGVPGEFIDQVFAVMAMCPRHTFQILTKRPDRMRGYLLESRRRELVMQAGERIRPSAPPQHWYHVSDWSCRLTPWPLSNVWLGTSCENQQTADERIPLLLQAPAAIRFISAEPLLGSVDLLSWLPLANCPHCGHPESSHHYERSLGSQHGNGSVANPLCFCRKMRGERRHDIGDPMARHADTIDWVIVGGESGPRARPMHPDWARSLRDQCAAAGVAFFFKQWGEWRPGYDRDRDDPDWRNVPKPVPNGERWLNLEGGHGFHGDRVVFTKRVGKKSAGRQLDGRTWDEFPIARESVTV